jgi:hypothetical protein
MRRVARRTEAVLTQVVRCDISPDRSLHVNSCN